MGISYMTVKGSNEHSASSRSKLKVKLFCFREPGVMYVVECVRSLKCIFIRTEFIEIMEEKNYIFSYTDEPG